MAEDDGANAASGVKAAPGLEKKTSRGVMGWLRQSSSRRLRSHDASRTPRGLQDIGAGHRDEGSRAEGSHSLAAMFKSMPHAESHQADDEQPAGGAVRDRHYQRAFSLCDSGPADGHAPDLKEEASKRSIHSDPGDLSDVSAGSTNPQPREGEAVSLAEKLRSLEQQAEKKQKPKRTSSASGLSRIGSFFTRSFSRGHSRRLKDSHETADDAKTGEGVVTTSSPALSVIVSAGSYGSVSPSSPGCVHLESPKPPPFSAAAWLQKFHEQEDATPGALAACQAAAEQLSRCLSELESSVRFVLDTSPQRLVKDGEPAKAGGVDAQGKEEEEHQHRLEQIRRAMDADGERSLSQMQAQEDQLLLSEFLQMMVTVRRLVDTFKFGKKARDALRHDLQGEEEQLRTWERQYGALRESNDFLQDLYNRVCKTRSGLLHDYHEECIRLNQSIQLLRDKIANTIADVFAEFEDPPALETLYGRAFPFYANEPPNIKSELRTLNGAHRRSYQQLVSGHLPPFIMRLKLYAYNSPVFLGAKRMRGDEQLVSSLDSKVPNQLFSPLRLDECLPRQSCIKSVPPGLAIMSSEAEIARYEARLWSAEEAGEGSWGSFRVFEQWLVDSMKWQWRDAFMYANLRERRGTVQQMIAAKKADLEEAVRLRLKQLWWGRLVEMQRHHTDRAGRLIKKELAQSGEACTPKEADESEQSEELVFCGMQMNPVDVEKALMSAEDARSRILRVTGNAAFTAFTKALESMGTEPRAERFKDQVQRASDLVRQYDDMNDDPGSYEVLERECMQTEAALALLKEEIATLEKKRSARQAQLATKRKNLTQALEKLAAAFDADNKQLAAIEAQWDTAGRVEELVQKWLPTADLISASKRQLAEQRAELDNQQAQLEDERRQLEAQKQKHESSLADHRKPSSSKSSPLSSPRHSSRRGSDSSGHAPSTSVSHSKSFMSRLFRASTARSSSPRHPKPPEDELASDSEASKRRTIVRQESVLSEVPLSELPPPLPRVKEEQQQQEGKTSDEVDRQQLHSQKTSSENLAEARDSCVQGPRSPPLSPQASPSQSSVLYVHLEPGSSPREAAATPSSEAHEAVNKQQPVGDEKAKHGEVDGGSETSRKREKAKNSAASISRKSQRKKKSMYSKLRSALSLSRSFHEGSEPKEQDAPSSPLNQEGSALSSEGGPAAHALPGDADEVLASSLSKRPSTEGSWVAVGRQSSVLAAIPNIFEVAEQEALNDHPGHAASEKDASGSDAKNKGRLISRAEGNPKEDADSAEQLRDYGEGETGRNSAALELTDGEAMGAPLSAASHHPTLADAFRRSYAPRREARGLASDDRYSPSPSSRERSITPDPLEEDEHHLTAFGRGQEFLLSKNNSGADITSSREHISSVEEDTPTEAEGPPVNQATDAAPIVAFPSLSAGSPAEFRWDRHQGNSPFAAFQEEGFNRGEMRRRRSDSESMPVHLQNALRPRKTTSRYVVEDDRIDLFLSNGQADLNAAVIGSCIFSLLDAEERQHCIFLMQNSFVQVPKGCMLVQRGDKVDTLYFVVSGSLGMTEPHVGGLEEDSSSRLNVPSNAGRRRSSYDGEVSQEEFPIELSHGAFVTPRAFVREQQTDHSVVALRPCTLQKLSFHSFQQVLSACIFRRAPQVMHSLGSCPILESLTRKERVQIAALLKWKIYLPEEIICYQGETCSSLFLVMHGRARALQYVERDGTPDVVDEFADGDNINAMALLQDAPSPVTLMAAAPDGIYRAALAMQRRS
ncbi:hypothetical protein Emag_002672 [Eimeria magna]